MGYYYEGMHYSTSEENTFHFSPSTLEEPAPHRISFKLLGVPAVLSTPCFIKLGLQVNQLSHTKMQMEVWFF